MSELRIEYMPVDDLPPNPSNPKGHALDEVDASMTRFGYVEPIVIDERTGQILSGHGRREALMARQARGEPRPLNVEVDGEGRWLAPVVRGVRTTSDIEAGALIVGVNELVAAGGWDPDRLAPLLEEIRAQSSLVGTGFTNAGLDDLLAELNLDRAEHDNESNPDPDAAPPPPAAPVTSLGDIWQLGPHTVLCGDATALEALPACDALISDPPYGMGLDTSWYGSTEVGSKFTDMGAVGWDAQPFDPAPFAQAATAVALFGANYFCTLLPEPGTWWVWDKRTTADGGEIGFSGGMPYELIWLRGDRAHRMIRYLWSGYYRQAGTPAVERHNDHPTQKPVAVMREVIEYLTQGGDVVLDPFGGSGSTLIACHQAGRVARLVEIDPRYVDVTCARYQRATGVKPLRAGEPVDFLAQR